VTVAAIALAVGLLARGGPSAGPGLDPNNDVRALQVQTITLQDGVDGFAGTSDTHIHKYLPNQNDGASGSLKLKREAYHILLRFEVPPPPAGTHVLSSSLELYAYDADSGGAVEVQVFPILAPWSELEATWNNRTATKEWGEPGCALSGTDRAADALTEGQLNGTGRWYGFDVTMAVQDWAAGGDNFGFLLAVTPASTSNTYYFRAADHWDTSKRPKLRITYGASLATPTATSEWVFPTPTGTTHITPRPTRTPDPRRTAMPDSLYPYPEQRVGVVVFRTQGIDVSSLHTGLLKFEDKGPDESVRALGLDSLTVIQVGSGWCVPWDPIYGDECKAQIRDLVAANPGHLWFIGNEPENPCRPGWMSSTEYARMYHIVRNLIKEHDPAARVGIGGVVLPSELRRKWLDNVLNSYQGQYGEPMPIDVWNVHNLLLSECPGPCRQTDPNPCPPGSRCSGGYVPPELWCSAGWRFTPLEQARFEYFRQLVVEFRTWMKERGFQDKELIITEMGVLAQTPEDSCTGCFPRETINQFMYDTFDYMMNETDPDIGYPADGYRLVQRWTWYALTPTLNFNGFLFERDGEMTDFGLNFANYTARFLSAPRVSIFFQRGWTGYREDCDTWIGPGESRPRDYTVRVAADATRKALLRFDVSVLPMNAQVVSATLNLRAAGRRSVDDLLVKCYGVRRPWEVGEASWQSATLDTQWEVPGCAGASDRDAEPLSSVWVRDAETTYAWDVTTLAREWVADPASNHGIVLEGDGVGSGYWTFTSSDQPELPPYALHKDRPKLELWVELLEPTPTTTSLPTATATVTSTVTRTPTATRTLVLTPTGANVYLPIVRRP
jgi:hypothetical protein